MGHTDRRNHGNTPPHEDLFHLAGHGSVRAVYLRCRPGPFAVVVMPGHRQSKHPVGRSRQSIEVVRSLRTLHYPQSLRNR